MSSIEASPKGDEPAKSRGRIDLLDAARGIALLAMLVYHFTWDLEFFGYLPAGTAYEGGWRLFARGIATSFLFLVGIGLVLAHAPGVRWRPFLKRLAQIAAGAAAVTVATLFISPESFVFFGILHQIALASLIGLLFLRLPTVLVALAGLLVIALPNLWTSPAMDPRWLAWIGFSANEPFSNDLVPIFPWTGVVLIGMAAGRWASAAGLWDRLRPIRIERAPATGLTWIGRHSLAFYLIHQPVSIALIAAYAQFFPPDRVAAFPVDCQRSCVAQGFDETYCASYCGCVQTQMTERNLLEAFLDGSLDEQGQRDVSDTILACSFDPNN